MLTGIGDVAFKTAYEKWVGEHAISSENMSAWYIPTLAQLNTFMNMLFDIKGGDPANGSEDFRQISEFEFVIGKMFDRNPIGTVNYASSTVNSTGNISGIRINVESGVITMQAAGISVSTAANQQALCRPMITIFK